MLVDGRELATFVAVVEEGGVVSAARKIGYSPARVSEIVRALEARLGVQLFERTGRGMRLSRSSSELTVITDSPETSRQFVAGGRIMIDGYDRESLEAKNAFGFFPDDLPVPESLTADELLAFHRRLRPGRDEEFVEPFLKILGLEAAALMQSIIDQFAQNGGGVLVATHDLLAAERYFSSVVILASGKMVAEGAPRDIAHAAGAPHLTSAFVALTGMTQRVEEARAEVGHLFSGFGGSAVDQEI